MTEQKINTATGGDAKNRGKKPSANKKQLWLKIVKWGSIAAAGVAALMMLISTLIVWIMTPARLTPLVEEQASAYLNADLKVERIELSFWKTFPHLSLEVDSLQIISHSLDCLTTEEKDSLPSDINNLLSIRSFRGGVNIFPLLVGKISLDDVVFDHIAVNLVQVNDSISNYQIVPATEDVEESDETTSIPEITINSFRIIEAGPLRYRSLADSLDIAARLENVDLNGPEAPVYRLEIEGGASLPLLKEFNLNDLILGLDGDLTWNPDTPFAIDADNMTFSLNDYKMTFATTADFTEEPMVTRFNGAITELPIEKLMTHIPTEYQSLVEPLKTDMLLSAKMELTQPWMLADTIMPSLKASLEIPRCQATYQTLNLSEIEGALAVDFNGSEIDKSVVDLQKLHLVGEGVNCDLAVKISNAVSDPLLDGRFNGLLDLSQIPPRIAADIPAKLSGVINGETTFRFAMSDLTEENFHRVKADGSLAFKDFDVDAEEEMTAWIRNGEIQFGTSDSYVREGMKVDSLLQVSLKVDTMSAATPDMAVEMKNFKAGVGTANRSNSADTTEINPFGGTIAVERLKFDSPTDSLRVRLHDARIGGALTRYNGNARSPLMNLRVFAGRMLLGQALNRVAVSDTEMALTVNLHNHDKKPNPTAISNSERNLRRTERIKKDSLAAVESLKNGNVDLTLDNDGRRLLRKWDYKGSLRARRGSLATPWFPLRNNLSDINLKFNSDSIVLTDLRYKAGSSDFMINGTISNLRRALTSLQDNTLGISFDVKSDTININEIVKAVFAGPAVAEQTDDDDVWETDGEQSTEILANTADTIASGPVIIPHNIDAHLRMQAKNILYSDLELRNFRGDLLVYGGAINLRNLSASADVGKVSLNGLYSSANPDSLQFGLGMRVDQFRLDKLTGLLPAIDSLLPAINNFAGVVNADVAVTTDLERNMDINIPSLRAALKIEGDSLVLLDPDTFKSISKWLFFKDKEKNMIDHMAVEVIVENSTLELYPFMFDIDRYRLGVMGHNDMAMNMNYHISVLKSPIPFKFGINVKGTPEKMKIRLGGAKFKENMIGERQVIADNTRVNLVQQIDNIFKSGVSKARLGKLTFTHPEGDSHYSSMAALRADIDAEETISYIDSLAMIRAGLIENPDTIRFPLDTIPVTAHCPCCGDGPCTQCNECNH